MDIWILTKSEFNDCYAYLYDHKPAMDELGEGYSRPHGYDCRIKRTEAGFIVGRRLEDDEIVQFRTFEIYM